MGRYEELTEEQTYDDIEIWSQQTDTQLSWGSTDKRYVKGNVPSIRKMREKNETPINP